MKTGVGLKDPVNVRGCHSVIPFVSEKMKCSVHSWERAAVARQNAFLLAQPVDGQISSHDRCGGWGVRGRDGGQ